MKRERLGKLAGVYPLADDDPRWRHDPRAVVTAAFEAGASVLQLRLKHTSDGDALELARFAVERAHAHGALLIVNDRYDIADLAGADGVHVGEDDLAPEAIPAPVRERLLVGLSTHTPEQVRASRERTVDYIRFGPDFGTGSKQRGYSERGLERLALAVAAARHPVVGIGGISLATIRSVAGTGATAAAVISAVADDDDPVEATRQLQGAFRAGTRE